MENLLEKTKFLRTALFDTTVGAVSASSKYVIQDVIKRLPENPKLIIEYGPGDGVITEAILEVLPPSARLFVVEPNKDFIKILNEIKDSRITIIEGMAQSLQREQLAQFKNADAVVASMPFSFLTPVERNKVVSEVFDILSPNGRFIISHQYSWLMREPLQKIFNFVTLSFQPKNLFPCFVLEARKKYF